MYDFEDILVLIAKTLGVICLLAFTVFFVFGIGSLISMSI